MKKLVYLKLNSYGQCSFPIVILWWFNDGMYVEPIYDYEKGTILYEHPFSEDGKVNILEADAACLKANNLKKMANDIVCYIEEF